MSTVEPTDIVCSVPACLTRRPRLTTDDYARAAGWHIYRQVDSSNTVVLEVALCPDHAGNQPRPRPLSFDGEQTLF